MSDENNLNELRNVVGKEVKIVREIISVMSNLEQASSKEEKNMLMSHFRSLKEILRRTAEDAVGILEDISMIKPLAPDIGLPKEEQFEIQVTQPRIAAKPKNKPRFYNELKKKHRIIDVELSDIDIKTLKRLKKKEVKKEVKREKGPSKYVRTANKFFGDYASRLSEKNIFATLKRDLVKAHLQYTPASYISVILFSTMLSLFAAVFVLLFLLFFSIGIDWPIITFAEEGLGVRFLKFFWLLLAFPIITFTIIYIYPSLEKKYIGNRIDQELPFATIHMSAIAGSLVEPSKMFNILISTGEYPFLERELTKLINEINVYGYDLVTSLRSVGFNSPSQRLAELFNGIAVTINSGGSLQDFFEKRAQSLLFDYRLEREKYTKTAETFMDIYISLVIAAPMILMLLLIMMRISGLGISLSTSMITLVMILGVGMINIIFLTFLQLKQPSG